MHEELLAMVEREVLSWPGVSKETRGTVVTPGIVVTMSRPKPHLTKWSVPPRAAADTGVMPNERTKRPDPKAGSRSRNRRYHTARDRAFHPKGVEAGHRPRKPRPSGPRPSPNRTESGRIRR